MKKIAAFLMTFLIVFSLCSCQKAKELADEKSTSQKAEETTVEYLSGYEIKGEGQNQFYLDIAFEKSEKHYNIKTDKDTVGAALEELKLIVGEQGAYGTYIYAVEGEEHRYEKGGKYWAFYVGDELAAQGIDLVEIENGQTYALKVE